MFMSGEYEPNSSLFDLDALDQDSLDAALIAQDAEIRRVQSLPDYPEAMARYTSLIQEHDTSELPIELKAVGFLEQRAIEIAAKLLTEPTAVPSGPLGYATRFFGVSDTSNEAILEAFHRYSNYFYTVSWAAGNGVTVAQARKTIDEFKALPKPNFAVDPNLKERPLRSDDPFRAAFQYDDFKIEDTDQRE